MTYRHLLASMFPLVLLLACSDSAGPPTVVDPPGETELPGFDVAPTSAVPGGVLRLTDLPGTLDPEAMEVWVGGEPAAFVVEDALVSVAVPIFPGAEGWPAPPAGPQTVEVAVDNAPVWRGRQKLTLGEPSLRIGSPRRPTKSRKSLLRNDFRLWAWVDSNHRPHAYQQGCGGGHSG